MASASESLVVRGLRGLAWLIIHYPRWVFYPQVLLFVICVTYTVDQLKFSTNRNDLVGREKRYHQNFLRFREEFPGQDDLVAVVESEDGEKNRQFVERLGAKLEAEPRLFKDVLYINDVKMLGRKALLFFPEEELQSLLATLRDYRPFIQQFARATNLNSLFRLVNQQIRQSKPEGGSEADSLVKALPALERILRQAADSLRRPGNPPAPGVVALFDAGKEAERRQYLTFADGKIYLVTAHAPREELTAEAVDRFRALVEETRGEVPGVNAGITGEPVLEIDEMAQSQRDTLQATLVSLLLVALIFVYGYSETGRPIKATVCLLVGLGYTMGYTTLVVGHLNILTITFAPMLIGLAIDFGVHLVTRYEEELRHGAGEHAALERAMAFTGQGILTGCLTTSAAFLAMGFTQFKGIQEMGMICSGGLLICLVPMMTMLPVLLLRGTQNVMDHQYDPARDRRARVERILLERPGMVLAVCAGISALALVQARKLHFDYNLLNMQSQDLPAVVFERKLIEGATKSVLYGAVVAGNLEQAVALEERLKALPSVAGVDSLARFLTEDQTGKLKLIGAIKQELAAVRFSEPDEEEVDLRELSSTLQFLQIYMNLAIREVEDASEPQLLSRLRSLRESIVQLRWQLGAMNPQSASDKLAAFELALFGDIRATFDALKHQDDRAPLKVGDLPGALRERFIGRTGKVLLQVYPRMDVWQRENQEVFVSELRTVDPDVTGTPVQLFEYTSLLVRSYLEAAGYAFVAIALMVVIQFRRLSAAVLALLPVVLGSLWCVGLMGWAEVAFNPANIMTAPLVVGIGVTNGVHILTRFAEEKAPSVLARSTGKAVLVSGLTTIAGFGSLLLAEHEGIASLGFLMAAGTANCMVAGLTCLPAILRFVKPGDVTITRMPLKRKAQ